MKFVPYLMLAASAPFLLGACGGADSDTARENAIEKAAKRQGFDVDATISDDGTEKIEVRQGAATMGRNLDRPSELPDDIHLPANWEIMAFSPVPPSGYSVQAMTDDSPEDIIDELRREMLAEGWTEPEQGPELPGPMKRQAFEKGKRLATFTIVENGDGQTVQLMALTLP